MKGFNDWSPSGNVSRVSADLDHGLLNALRVSLASSSCSGPQKRLFSCQFLLLEISNPLRKSAMTVFRRKVTCSSLPNVIGLRNELTAKIIWKKEKDQLFWSAKIGELRLEFTLRVFGRKLAYFVSPETIDMCRILLKAPDVDHCNFTCVAAGKLFIGAAGKTPLPELFFVVYSQWPYWFTAAGS